MTQFLAAELFALQASSPSAKLWARGYPSEARKTCCNGAGLSPLKHLLARGNARCISSPQSETIWSAHETPGDLIRLALGFAVSLWMVIHLFILPKTVEGYRTWVYLGLVVAPLALVMAIAVWR